MKVVIIGAGFGGLACARALDGTDVGVLLIDRENDHLFTPLLYQVATALLNPSDIAYPIRKVFRRSRNVRFRQGLVIGVDLESKTVHLADGGRFAYDRLVLATGSVNNYFGNPALAGATIGMKPMGEAMRLRNHVLSCLEMAARISDPDERRPWLTFVVAGGGPTGVEYAGALSELLRFVLGRDYPNLALADSRIVLVEGSCRLLGQFPKRLDRYAANTLAHRGVDVHLATFVKSADEGSVRLSSGLDIPCRTVVWSAGVRPIDPVDAALPDRSRDRRVQVDRQLRVIGRSEVFAVGDVAGVLWGGTVLPMLAPPAMQQGRYVARVLRYEAAGRPVTRPFRYIDKGTMATIGRSSAVAQIGPITLTGLLGWVTWLAVHISYLVGFRNRLAVLWSWGWDYLWKDRAIRIIAQSGADQLTETFEGTTAFTAAP